MAKTHSTHPVVARCLPGLAGLILFARSACGQYDPDWADHIRLGGIVGLNIKAHFSMAGQFNVSGNGNPGTNGVHGVNHVYDDGYVRVDSRGNEQGYTSYYGYNSASQFNYAAQTLTMHSTTSFSTAGTSGSEDAKPMPGVELVYGGNFWYWGRARIGLDFGFGLLPIYITEQESADGNSIQSVYSFNTRGVQGNNVQLPKAPYNGPANPTGVTSIQDVANLTGTNSLPGAGTMTGSQTLDVILYTFRLGPSLYWDFNRHLGMSVSAGPALGLVSGEVRFNEKISTTNSAAVAPNRGHISGTQVVYGGYANATLMYHAIRNGDIFIGAQYMPMGNATISGGGRKARLDLGGQLYISAGLNWPF